MSDIELSDLLKSTSADGAIIISTKGELIEVINIDSAENVAGMLGVLVNMCKSFSEDLNTGEFDQFMLKSTKGVFMADKISKKDDIILGLYSKDLTKGGLMKASLDRINK